MSDSPTLEALARRAVDGDREAVAGIVRGISGDVYALSLRMLWHREDAEDATQEILVRVLTRLAQFDFRSRLRTWVYRVATNYLLDVKRSCVERKGLTFTAFADDLAEGLSGDGPAENEHSLLVAEVKIGCTLGMLQCLDRPHRIAYVLGEILEMPAPEAASVLDLEPAAFRKRLQRARASVEAFTSSFCGLVSDTARCKCNQRVPAAVRLGRIERERLSFAGQRASFEEARTAVRRVEQGKRVLELHRLSGLQPSGVDFAELVVSVFDMRSAPPRDAESTDA